VALSRRLGAIEERLKCRIRPAVSIRGSQETMCRVMAEIDSAKLPNELIHIEVSTQVSSIDGLPDKLAQQLAPLAFHCQYLVPDRALYVIELEEAGGYRASARQAGSLCPPEPVVNQSAQTGQPLFSGHGRLRNMFRREFRHMLEESNLDFLFRVEVSEESTLRHSHLIRQHSQRDASQARLAHQRESLMQDSFAR